MAVLRSLLLLASAAISTASPAGTESSSSSTTEPCALVAQSLSESQGPPIVNADTALACLRSVPLAAESNALLLQGFKQFAQFTSNLEYLKTPPPGALYPPIDVFGTLDDIERKLKAGFYANEYDFHIALWEIAASSHDYHFVYTPDILGAFSWTRALSLISVSSDALRLPDVYVLSDLPALVNNSSDYKAAPVVKINSANVETWLNQYASLDPYGHDPDTNYNNVMYNGAQHTRVPAAGNGSFVTSNRYQGNTTLLEFANGTTTNMATFATTGLNFTDVTDGKSFFEKFCTGKAAAPSEDESPSTPTENEAPPNATAPSEKQAPYAPIPKQTSVASLALSFPEPWVYTQDRTIAGYLPENLPDVAVLATPSFEVETANAGVEFQNAIRGLLATAKSQNRTKLIIDVRGNGGGSVYTAYDFLKQLFPDSVPWGASNIRSPPLLQVLGGVVGDYFAKNPYSEADAEDDLKTGAYGSILNPYIPVDVNIHPFTSSASYFGPYKPPGFNDNFTAVSRNDLNQTSQTSPVTVYGYGNNTAPQPQTFAPDNILLLTDGFCGSTCAIFSEFMKSQGGVKSVAVGGRKSLGAMQGVGGTKGSQVIGLSDLSPAFAFALLHATAEQNTTIKKELPDFGAGASQLGLRTQQGKGAKVNIRNNLRQGDTSLTPLQYVYEAADARLFYTAPMLIDQTKLWEAAYKIHWSGAPAVAGSTNHPSSLSGELLSYIDAYPPVGANYTFNASTIIIPSNNTSNPARQSPVPVTSTDTATMATGTGFLKKPPGASASASASAKPSGQPTSGAQRSYTGADNLLNGPLFSGLTLGMGVFGALLLL